MVTDVLGCVSASSAVVQVINTGMATVNAGRTRVFPNPATDLVRIERLNASPATVTFLDAQGRVVRSEQVRGSSNTMDVSGLVPGLYLVRIASGAGVESVRLVKD